MSGRTIAFVDKGLDADGQEADQVVTIDVATGTRTQVTRLPFHVPPPPYCWSACCPYFIDERTIRFSASANPGGLNPEGVYRVMTIKTDGSDLQVPLPIPVALPGRHD